MLGVQGTFQVQLYVGRLIVQTPVGEKHLKGKWVLNGHTTQTTITASEQSAH